MFRPLKNTTRKAQTRKARTPQTSTLRAGACLLSALSAAALGACLLPAASQAAGYAYQQHTLNAGVLVNGTDPAPYLFYVLNNRPDVRPPDLTLVNPLAPATVTPNRPAYWEVPLNTISDSQMSQYDVLYLPAGTQAFTPAINEMLRRFVDNGGQLIVEYGTAASPIGLFTGAATTPATGTGVALPSAGSGSAFLRQPIVSQPYLLSASDLTTFSTPVPPGSTNPDPIQLALVPNIPNLPSTPGDPVHSMEFSSIFSSALVASNGTVVSTAQIGAGQVVVSALNLGPGIGSSTYGHTDTSGLTDFNPVNLYLAPAADLKLMANILAWSEAHPNENKTSHGNASNNGLASFSPAWQYLPMTTGTAAPSGAAVWGNFVFAVDSAGTLHAFDAYPAENLTGNANAQGAETALSQYPLTSYDEIWNNANVGKGASTPTLAAFNGINYVFVETNSGTVGAFNAVTGAAAPFTLKAPAAGGSFTGTAPGPTYYDGRLYAGQADGTLHVYDLNEASSGTVTGVAVALDPSQNDPASPVTGAPAVGTLASGTTSVLVAVVPTNNNIYTVLLGARNEALKQFDANGALAGYSINRLGSYDLSNIFADTFYSNLLAYDYNGNVVTGVSANPTAPNPQDPLFAITNTLGYYTDWNMDFTAAAGSGTTPNPLNVNFISADSYGQLQDFASAAAVSAPASDRRGNYYYTETMQANSQTNSYVVGVANAPLHSNVHVKFRFLMPTAALTDADNVDYAPLVGFHFVGAPVVDDQGNVYAAAVNGPVGGTATQATVLCFRGDQAVSVTEQPGSTFDLSQSTITQPDENSTQTNTIQRGPDTGVGTAATYGQYIAAAPTVNASGTVIAPSSLTFYNFGKRGRTFAEIAGNLTEPQPIIATSADGANTMETLPLQTNLAWYVLPFALTAPASSTAGSIQGLSLVGSSLFLCDGTSLYRLSTDPQVSTAQVTGGTTPISSSKVVTAPPEVTPIGAGLVGTPPSIGGSVMAINGTNGIAARTRQVTVIADSNRVLGVDGDGSAVWSVDATTRTDLTQTPAVSTRVPFSRPTSLSAFAVNDYLAADTGTNRCVRFDTGGDVKWELTRFQDPYGLMALGQPLTLNQPTSVVTRPAGYPITSPLYPGDSGISYLVADSGNDRIVEVTDFYNPTTGVLDGNHILTWVSHTGDQGGRRYRYGSATYYPYTSTDANGKTVLDLSIAATVTNTRLAPLVANPNTAIGGSLLGSVSSDAPGGSIVVFNYPLQTGAVSYNNLASVKSDLAYTVAGFYTSSVSGGSTAYAPVTIRNPRFLEFYTPAVTTAAPPNAPSFNFLYADDNGAFDLSYDTTRSAFVAGADRLQFRPAAYQNMTAPTDAPTNGSAANAGFSRTNLPFIPTCVQALSTDSQPTSGTPGGAGGGTANITRRYLITQNSSQSELGTPTATGRIGGEVFEIDVAASLNYPASTTAGVIPPPSVTAAQTTAPGGFGSVLIPASGNTPAANVGSTLSHPALTGPLTQPTFAVRLP